MPDNPHLYRPYLDAVRKDHHSSLASSHPSGSMNLELENIQCEAHLHSHLSQATARDAVSSSQTDKTLSRSHLSTGIVDERQTYVWPEFYESAQTSVGPHSHGGRSRALPRGHLECDSREPLPPAAPLLATRVASMLSFVH